MSVSLPNGAVVAIAAAYGAALVTTIVTNANPAVATLAGSCPTGAPQHPALLPASLELALVQAFRLPEASASSSSKPEVRAAQDHVENYTAKAWCVLRDEKRKAGQERWLRTQAAWLQKQKKLGVESLKDLMHLLEVKPMHPLD